jgi:hypothetical protein
VLPCSFPCSPSRYLAPESLVKAPASTAIARHIATVEGNGRKDYEEMFDAGRCLGYVKGVSEGLKTLHGACYADATLVTMIRVYLVSMDRNPKLFDETEAFGLSYALHDAYPCPAK